VALDRKHDVIIVNSRDPIGELTNELSCAIEFTNAEAAPNLIRTCVDKGIPVVSGTTGWDSERAMTQAYCLEHLGTMLWSPNFSVGMNIVFEINKQLAKLMNLRPEYDVEILESHHTEKKDKPSGTAIALANQVLGYLDRKKQWQLADDKAASDETLSIIAERVPDVKGIHRVTYSGPHDIISIRHKALSRDAFALGAVIAAEWLVGRETGIFSFADVLAT
jgi:4-hydroxy-tetrahydrodipicolinate reductase